MYETSKILHRDISVGNIMFSRDNSSSGSVRGVLCDWDLAYDPEDPYATERKQLEKSSESTSEIDRDTIVIKEHSDEHVGPRYRTGTGPFMAVDLLTPGDVPPHLYRHDLESFFYVLVWFCAVFDPETCTLKHLVNWESQDLVSIGKNKRHFLSNADVQFQIYKRIHAQYQTLAPTWIAKLRPLFELVNVIEWHKLEQLGVQKMQAKIWGWEIDPSALEKEAQDIEQARNEAMTYEKFMCCLGYDA